MPPFASNQIPAKIRRAFGSSRLVKFWMTITQQDEVFQLPTTAKTSLEDIFTDLETIGGMTATELMPDRTGTGRQRAWQIRLPGQSDDDATMRMFQQNNDVWIDVTDSVPGQFGKRIYNAVANYAFNNGKLFIGDPTGLSDIAVSRRLENMISSTLKFHTTAHLQPHEKQVTGAAGVPGIKWIEGRHGQNLTAMLHASYEATRAQFPEIDGIHYNSELERFERISNGTEYTNKDFNQRANDRRGTADKAGSRDNTGTESRSGSEITAGGSTLKRAVLIASLVHGTREEKSRLLESVGRLGDQHRRTSALDAILY